MVGGPLVIGSEQICRTYDEMTSNKQQLDSLISNERGHRKCGLPLFFSTHVAGLVVPLFFYALVCRSFSPVRR